MRAANFFDLRVVRLADGARHNWNFLGDYRWKARHQAPLASGADARADPRSEHTIAVTFGCRVCSQLQFPARSALVRVACSSSFARIVELMCRTLSVLSHCQSNSGGRDGTPGRKGRVQKAWPDA